MDVVVLGVIIGFAIVGFGMAIYALGKTACEEENE